MKAIALLGGPKEEWPQNLADKIKLAQKKGALICSDPQKLDTILILCN